MTMKTFPAYLCLPWAANTILTVSVQTDLQLHAKVSRFLLKQKMFSHGKKLLNLTVQRHAVPL